MLPYMDHRVLPRAGRAVPYTERGTFLLLSLPFFLFFFHSTSPVPMKCAAHVPDL